MARHYLILLALLIAGAAFGLLHSPYFELREVAVEGNSLLSRDEIILKAGIREKTNIFQVDTNGIRGRIKSIPCVEEVRVARRLPSTLVISVKEREACLIFPYAGYFVEVGPDRVALGLLETLKFRGLPVVSGLEVDKVVVGEEVKAPGIDEAISVAMSLSRGVIQRVSEVHVEYNKGVTLYTADRIRVELGWGEVPTLSRRARLFEEILQQNGRLAAGHASIDLRSEKRPVIRMERP